MSDETIRLSVIGRLLRKRWPVLTALAVLGALVGFGSSALFSPGYRASTSVVLQGAPDSGQVTTQAQLATSTVVLERTTKRLDWPTTASTLKRSVSATTSTGNIVTVAGTASSPRRAKALSDQLAKQYVAFANKLAADAAAGSTQQLVRGQAALRTQISGIDERIKTLDDTVSQGGSIGDTEVAGQLDALRSSLDAAVTQLAQAGSAPDAVTTAVVAPAHLPSRPAQPTLAELTAAGAVVFVLLGVLGHLLAARLDRRLRDKDEVAAALSAPVLGTVDAPARKNARDTAGWRRQLRLLIRDDRTWNSTVPPTNATGRKARYLRVLAKLPDSRSRTAQTVILVAEDDPLARHASTRLVREGRGRGAPLRVLEVDVGSPDLPNLGPSGVVMVVGRGTRTAWELVGLSGVCADASYRVTGVVIVDPSDSAEPEPGPQAPSEPWPNHALNGGSVASDIRTAGSIWPT
jgi:capsular polysaccharide biosynthesis protein